MEYYCLVNTKTYNTVYVTESSIMFRKKDGRREQRYVPIIAMCGYGPLGKMSRGHIRRPLAHVKNDVKILLTHPRRKKDLANLRIEKRDAEGNILKTHSMSRFIRDAEQELIIKKLRA